MGDLVNISIAFANDKGGQWFDWQAPAGSSIRRILSHPSVIQKIGLTNFESTQVGVWGKKVDASTQVTAGDRIELYQPLQIDPKEARKLRAAKNPKTRKERS